MSENGDSSVLGMIYTLDTYAERPANHRSVAVINALQTAFREVPEGFRPACVIFSNERLIENAFGEIASRKRAIAIFDGCGPGHFSLLPRIPSDGWKKIPAWARDPERAVRVHGNTHPDFGTTVRGCANQIRAFCLSEWSGIRCKELRGRDKLPRMGYAFPTAH